MKRRVYITTGSVRGSCGHQHHTLNGALKCLERDRRSCAASGGGAYSDRDICRIDADGKAVPLSDAEIPEDAP